MSDINSLIVTGTLVGLLGGFAGIGGAPLMVSFMTLILGFPQLRAQGIVLTMMLGPMSLLGLSFLYGRRFVLFGGKLL